MRLLCPMCLQVVTLIVMVAAAASVIAGTEAPASGPGTAAFDSSQPATSAFCPVTLSHHVSAENAFLAYADGGRFGLTWREITGPRSTIGYTLIDSTGAVINGPVVVTAGGDYAAGQVPGLLQPPLEHRRPARQ